VLAIGADGSHTLDLRPLPSALGPVREDGAASVIALLGDALLAAARELERRTRLEELCLGGALAELPVLHTRLFEEGPFRRVLVPPAPGEVGASAGAALLAAAALGAPRARPLEHVFLGEDLLLAEVEGLERGSPALEPVLRALGEGRRVGWVSRSRRGRAPLARTPQPAASIRPRRASPIEASSRSRPCPPNARRSSSGSPRAGREAARLAPLRLRPRAAPVQLVEAEVDPAFHELLTRYGERSGMPLLACLPLSRPGEPSVRREIDARELLEQGVIDLLFLEGRVHERSGRPISGILIPRP
jgi:carbamoyltransferase